MIQKGHAFILTGHSEDQGNEHIIRFWCIGEQGPFEVLISGQKPLFFIEKGAQIPELPHGGERRNLGLKTFGGSQVDALYFLTQKSLNEFKDKLYQLGVRTFEADVRSHERFLMERFIFGSFEYESNNSIKKTLVNPVMKPSQWFPKFSFVSFDIETSFGNDLYSIGVHGVRAGEVVKKVFMVGESQGQTDDFDLIYCSTEKQAYELFENFIFEFDPDLIYGWHVVGFDLNFLERKCRSWGKTLNLGKNRKPIQILERQSGLHIARIEGRVVVDGPVALRSAFYQFDDFKLQTVAFELLGESKEITETSNNKVAEIERRFKEEKLSLAKYNMKDCTLVSQIYEHTQIVEQLITRSQLSGLPLDRIGVSTAAFDFYLLPRIHRKGYVAPNVVDINRELQSSGGYVLDPVAGLQQNVAVLDFKSLYPSVIRTFKIDPYSRLKSSQDTLQTPSGHFFSRTEHLLPELIENLMEQRDLAKKKNDQHLSQAIKILMNSFYGVMGTSGSRFYHADLPSAITGTGQWILKNTIDFLKKKHYEVIYGDTDSVFIKLKKANSPYEESHQLALEITQHFQDYLRDNFQLKSHLEMEFDKFFPKFFLPNARNKEGGAKKRYAGLVMKNDNSKQLYFSGMEIVRSDWTELAKNFQRRIFEMFFNDEELSDFIKDYIKQLNEGEFDSLLVYKKKLTKSLSEYVKSLPPHVKAAKLLEEAGLPLERDIRYIMTRTGPIPIELEPQDIDYQHYIEKQIRPLAQMILEHLGQDFDNLTLGDQLSLF